MPDHPKNPQADELLAEALNVLIKSQAPGRVVMEFVEGFRPVLEQRLAPAPAAAPEIDLTALIQDAVRQSLEVLVPALGEARQSPAQAPESTRPEIHRFTVSIAGRRTTVTVRRELHERLVAATGTKTAVAKLNEFATSKPASWKNRSSWVAEQVVHLLVLTEVTAQVQAPH